MNVLKATGGRELDRGMFSKIGKMFKRAVHTVSKRHDVEVCQAEVDESKHILYLFVQYQTKKTVQLTQSQSKQRVFVYYLGEGDDDLCRCLKITL